MNVMLVDDYPLIIEGFKKLFNWKKHGFPVVATANNGRQAACLLKTTPVDIVFTDIKMPVLNGLELIKIIKAQYPHIKIVVLSAYDDFQLVRNAFNLGANNYMLKQEMNEETIMDICKYLQNEIELERKRSNTLPYGPEDFANIMREKEELEYKLNVNLHTIRERFFKRLITYDDIDKNDDILREQIELKIIFESQNIALMLFKAENIDYNIDIEPLSFAIETSMRSVIETNFNAYLFVIDYSKYGIIFSIPSISEFENYAHSVFTLIQKQLYTYVQIVVTAGVSNVALGLAELRHLFTQAQTACEYRFIYGKNKLLFFKNIPDTSNEIHLKYNDRIDFLIESLKSKNFYDLLNSLDTLCVSDKGLSVHDIHQVNMLFHRYTWIIINFIEDQNLAIDANKLLITFQFLSTAGSVEELNSWLTETLQNIVVSYERDSRYIAFFKQYIKEHYREGNLKIDEIADYIGISANYLGKLVYKETNCHFSEYLNIYRIEQAKSILSNSILKIYEVAEQVGYNNVEHFARVFKRLVDMSPSAYANKNTQIAK